MDAMLEQFRKEATSVGNGRGRKFPSSLKALGGEYARGRRAQGVSWEAIAGELGVIAPTVQRWAEQQDSVAGNGFRAVSIVEPKRGGYTAVLPGGLRIEGLEFEAVIALARSLA